MLPVQYSDLSFILFLSGLVALDTTAVGQILLSQPLFSCPLLGFCLGDLQTGVYIGLLMELLWLKLVPIGGAIFYEGNIGSFTTTGVAILSLRTILDQTGLVLLFSIIYGFSISYLGGQFTIIIRKLTQLIVNKTLARAMNGHVGSITYGHLGSIAVTFVGGCIFGTIAILIGSLLLPRLLATIPESGNQIALIGVMALWGTGIGMVLSMFWEARKSWALIGGILLGLAGSLLL